MKKNKVRWRKYFSNNFKTSIGFTVFYLIPTIEFFMDTEFDDDCCFDVRFEWLFWSLTFSRYLERRRR